MDHYNTAPLLQHKGSNTISIGGHRGTGENLWQDGAGMYPNIRENTQKAFKQAVDMGASFVEFDVQVTKDGVPIIWHDDDVVNGDPENPLRPEVKDLTLQQFQDIGQPSSPPGPAAGSLLRLFKDKATLQRLQGYKKWEGDDEGLPTLKAVFDALPESVGFDIEVKMAVPDTIEQTPQAEIDRMLGAILPVVETCSSSGQRTIMYSSFDPDVCTALKQRQSRHPVMFLSGCGLYQHVDPRRTSIDAAVSFASSTGLEGIVVPIDIVQKHPELAQMATDKGLKVLTYGLGNSDGKVVQWQCSLGVHAAIVDDLKSALSGALPTVPVN